ncbi:MAG TPA: hypothetical protein VF929_06440 [Gemmatimonadaceae bacterium]
MTPDNAGYYHAAYLAAAAIYVGYAISLRVRLRRLRARVSQIVASNDQA